MARLEEIIINIQNRLSELERRRRNARRTGTIDEVDTKKGLARVTLVDDGDKKFRTGWLPWKEIAAGMTSTHIPPIVGQQVDVLSENGDLTDGVIDFSIHSNANKRPHDGPQAVIVHGNTRITLDEGTTQIETSDVVTINVPKTHITGDLEIDGNFLTKGNGETRGSVDFKGGYVRHNGKNIGDSHKHTGVKSGGDVSSVPE